MNTSVTSASARIDVLDMVRGLAILGIFILNIGGFALPSAAYLNPMYTPVASATDIATWAVLSVLVQGKFLGMFALLFGATLMMLSRYSQPWNMARLLVLGVIGLLHTALLWDGDILLMYSLTGVAACWIIHNVSSRWWLKLVPVLILTGLFLLFFLLSEGGELKLLYWRPSQEMLDYEVLIANTGGIAGMLDRISTISGMLMMMVVQYGWQLLAMMLLGATLMKNGWLKGAYPLSHYRRLAAWLLIPSLLLQAVVMWLEYLNGWSVFWMGTIGYPLADILQPVQTTGLIALFYGLQPQLKPVAACLQRVGRTALSSYLLQSVCGVILFEYLGYFCQFDRLTLLAFVPLMWLINILFSTLWLRYFSQGPVEWLWRQAANKLAAR
ncbi:DUF418 domain-containing protein YeiB [Morganella morganii]|uniref:DUF418 domain-containing protein YeiB n=1 Tax=Morganella morganii TaxID=582 RepID=UPI000BBD24FD|nr:DUF418 domain-containing protein YeiB [Morganella morganii]ATF54324.1 hypothetical protein CO693_11745 [Morganella morganii]EKU4001363.1 DUF418 domain-containing protein [Morganella morganii]MBT0354802.1 DUF418 domain-containing protein [Morganella morganii subsp. morganii]MBT0405406.1 DUF418 domain-containing protein [Morganella morganii subsp. morganii]MBT0424558.1 DUF418 domain-containing protein [Morganella morganii subsp. morganii]